MCEFISWKEVKTAEGTEIFFLTYDDIYNTKRGKELRDYTKNDGDLIGHGAIDYFYDLKGRGANKECTDFSTPKNFPDQIVEAIKRGKFYLLGAPVGLLLKAKQ